MGSLFRIAVAVLLQVICCSVPTPVYSWQDPGLEDKQAQLEKEIETKTGEGKLHAYRELVDENLYVRDEIRLQHIQQMLSEYEAANDSKGIGTLSLIHI